MNKRLAFIGCGNMGEALLKGLLSNKLFSRGEITVSDKSSVRLKFIKKTYRVNAASSNIEAVKKSDILILAVKPQDMASVLAGIAQTAKSKLIITIAAGVTTSYIKQKTGAKRIIRAMPNTPALVGYGITAIVAAKGTTKSDINIVDKIFRSVGDIVHLNEKQIDAVTAVSGSGPAYFFLFMERLTDAAISLGIKRPVAEKLVLQTGLGAAALQHITGTHPKILRNKVTSKGGTTEAALKVFKKKGLEKIVKAAVSAACKKSKQLSK
ncbi:MAG: pyrroline-5-carboxylate reductase [Candidatus Omnitrophica bacterium]|nr:pyrroline-5-carboxylate reductase [Candidatus Omnitrophota bacterium]